MADPSSNKELSWSMTMDDTQMEKAMKDSGLRIKDFDKQLKSATASALALQKAVSGISIPNLSSISTSAAPSVSTTSTKAAEDSISALSVKSKQLKADLALLSAEERKNSLAAKEMQAEYKAIQTDIKTFNDSLKVSKATINTTQLGSLKSQFDALGIDIKELSAEQISNIKITKEQAKALSIVGTSNKKLEAQLNLNRKVMNVLTTEQLKSVKVGVILAKTIDKQDIAVKKFRASMGQFQGSVGNYIGAMRKMATSLNFLDKNGKATFSSLAAGFGTITKSGLGFGASILGVGGAVVAFQKIVQYGGLATRAMYEYSDAVADVRKVTGQSQKEFKALENSLKNISSRTNLTNLLKLAEAGGRFSVANEQMVPFVETLDKIFIALSAELSGSADEIGIEIAKIADSFVELGDESLSEGMLKVGSVINEVAQNTKAQAQSLVDFSAAMIGASKQFKLSAAEVVAMGTVFDTMKIEAPVAATAMNQLFIMLGRKIPEASAISGKSIEEFTRLLKEDSGAAVRAFAAGLTGTGTDLETVGASLDGLGLKGQKVVRTLFALGNGQDTYTKALGIANKQLKDTNSIIDEAAIKNDTLAGSWDRIAKSIKGIFQSAKLNESLGSVLKTLATGLETSTRYSRNVALIEERVTANNKLLGKSVIDLTSGTKDSESAMQALNDAMDFTKGTDSLSKAAAAERAAFIKSGAYTDEVANKVDNARKAQEKYREETYKKYGLQSWDEYIEKVGDVDKITNDLTVATKKLQTQSENVRIPDLDIVVTPENLGQIENKIKVLTNAKELLQKGLSDLLSLPVVGGEARTIAKNSTDQITADIAKISDTIEIAQGKIKSFETDVELKKEREAVAKKLAIQEEYFKTREEKAYSFFSKQIELIDRAEELGTLTIAEAQAKRDKAYDVFSAKEIAKEQEKADKKAAIIAAAEERFVRIGATKLESENAGYEAELQALRELEDKKIELTKTYDEIRLTLKAEHAAKVKDIEDTETAERLAKIEEENQLLINSAENAVGGIASAFKQLAIEGKGVEDVFASMGKAALSYGVDVVASLLKIAIKNKIIGAFDAKASIATASTTAASLTALYTTPATLATIMSFGSAAALAPGAIAASLAASAAIVGGASTASSSLGTTGFENTGGLAGMLQGVQKAQTPSGNGAILEQLQANAYNQSNVAQTPINVTITSHDPNPEVAISYAKSQNELVASGVNVGVL